MNDFYGIDKLIDNYFSGRVQKIVMEVEENHHLHMKIFYEDSFENFFDYDFDIFPDLSALEFHRHLCHKLYCTIDCDRDTQFEEAVCTHLKHTNFVLQ